MKAKTYLTDILVLLLILVIFPSFAPLHADDQIGPNPNDGTINVAQDDWNDTAFLNNGTLNITPAGSLENNESGTFTNYGTLNNNALLINCGSLNNNGTLNNNDTFGNCSPLNNAGTINNNSGSWLYNADGAVLINTGSIINAAGAQLTNQDGALLVNNGTLTNNGWLGNDGGATLTNNGLLINNGLFINVSVLNNNRGAILTNSSSLRSYGTLTNAGTLNNLSGATLTLYAGAVLTNDGTLNNASGATMDNRIGATITNNGTFINDGTFTNSGTLNNNGTLMGMGTIIGNVINSGTLAPGNSIGAMTIVGNYTHNAGAVYAVEITAAGQSDRLAVTGAAVLNGGAVFVRAASGNYVNTASTSYTILTAGSVTGSFAYVTSDLAFMTPSLGYDPTHVYLLLTRNSTRFADVASTANQRSVASALDDALPRAAGDMLIVMDNLLDLTAAGARDAYDRLGGLIHTSLAEATFFSLSRYIGTMTDRMDSFFGGEPLRSDMQLTLLASRIDLGSDAGHSLLAALGNARTHSKADERQQDPEGGLWMRGYGSMGGRNGDDTASRYDYRNGGIVFGFDKKVAGSLLLGFSGGYSYTRATMKDLPDSGTVAGYQGSLYGAWLSDPWYVNGLIAYSYNRFDTSRNIVFGEINRAAHAGYGGHAVSGYTETGYRIRIDTLSIIPMVSLQAGYLSRDSFTETDAGALNLDLEKDHASTVAGSLGVRLRKDFRTASGIVTPEFRVRWLHEFSSGDYTANATFAGSPLSGFSVKGDDSDRDSADLGCTLRWQAKESLGLLLSYNANLSGSRTEHGISLGVRYAW